MSDEYIPSPVTPVEILIHKMLMEQKKTNELLQKLVGAEKTTRKKKEEDK